MYEIFRTVSLTVIILSMQFESETVNAFHGRYAQCIVTVPRDWGATLFMFLLIANYFFG
jgi:hypothetical protein